MDPGDYAGVLAELREHSGVAHETRQALARKAFERTAAYDTAIHAYLTRQQAGADPFPPRLAIELARAATLRYGENPHQKAALYGGFSARKRR